MSPDPTRIIPDANTSLTRRTLLAGTGSMAVAAAIHGTPRAIAQTPSAEMEILDELVIDLAGAPDSIDPALAYAPRDWSIVHSLYDAPVTIDESGEIVPLAAESFLAVDDVTWELRLLEGGTFHDGSPVTSEALVRSLDHVLASESDAAGLFSVIAAIDVVDDVTCRIVTSQPAPWLPAQIAVYLVLLPEISDSAELLTAPIGSGPYRFESQETGVSITLMRNAEWVTTGTKGRPVAERVTYRFVPEPSTRIADLATGAAGLITEIPHDQMQAISDGGAQPIEVSVVGTQFIRIATDVSPFDIPEVCQALNHAIDAEAIAQALVSPEAHRLASIFPDERALGYDPDLSPFSYDPEAARELLEAAGLSAIDTVMEVTTGARLDVAEAIAGQLAEIGINATVQVSDYATFNGTWGDSAAPALRMVTWAPMFDPQSLLGLVFADDGYLSRFENAEVDSLIATGSSEADPFTRQETYADLGRVMQEVPAAVYLWNLTSGYGVSENLTSWSPRGDDWVLPLSAGSNP